jgi:hypothetical protein
MNERSFIVKSDLSGNGYPGHFRTLAANRAKDALLRRKLGHSAQRDGPALFDAARNNVQDFVSHTGCTVCETTGTGFAVG